MLKHYPDRFQYSLFQFLTPYSGFDDTRWFFIYCQGRSSHCEL